MNTSDIEAWVFILLIFIGTMALVIIPCGSLVWIVYLLSECHV